MSDYAFTGGVPQILFQSAASGLWYANPGTAGTISGIKCGKTHFHLANQRMTVRLPWQVPPLDEWSIVGMNHYHANGHKHLYVAMVKDGRCIKAESADDSLWLNLIEQAVREQEGRDD